MSASRRHRRAAARYRQDEMLREADRAPVSAIRELDAHHDAISKGGVLFILPKINDAMPAELKNAITRRRQAALTGRCECGVVRGPMRTAHRVGHAVMRHERDCPASDATIAELARSLGWRWTA